MSKKSRGFHAHHSVRRTTTAPLTLRPVTAAVLAVLGTGLSLPAFAAPPLLNNIVADGRTQTAINTSGGVTNITTQTVSGADAFNSFSQFQEAAGNQVNLYLPTNTDNLINLVTGGQAQINGILNSYKNGRIGGRVFFADPYGLVVGAQGVINVGALSASAPTQQFMDQLMGADGTVDGTALSALLSGTEALSANGAISIQGEVHALDAVRLQAEKVDASGLIWVMGGDGSDALAGDAVNTQSVTQGTALVNHGGSIEIVSGSDTNIEGRLQANGNADQGGGGITILAGQNANIGGSAEFSAKGQGSNADGGQIVVKSGNDTTVANGARFVASAGTSGNGGQIEVSAANTLAVGTATFDASASHGQAGSLLFDPVDQSVISGTISSPGTNFDDEDATSIEVTSTGKVDTTSTTAAAGNITLGAPSISVDAGGQLIANDGTHTPGTITLDAEQAQSVGSGLASASTSITVAGVLNGGEIDIKADASGTASYSSIQDTMKSVQDTLASMPADWASKLSLATDSFLASLLPVGVDIGAASASIDIQNGANIHAAGNLTIASSTDTKASMPALNSIGGTPVVAAAVYGEVYGNASTTVDSGATLSVTGSNALTVQATNKDELEVSATVNSDAQSVDVTAAIGYANVNSNASIAAGANVSAPNVVVLAHNSNSFGVDSAVTAAQGGQAGIAAAVSITNTNATAQENANLGSATLPINSLVVDASSSADKNKTGADTSVGGQASSTSPTDVIASGGDSLPDYLQELLGKELTKADAGADKATGSSSNSSEPSTSPFKLGSAISVADSSQNASATIGANANVYASNQVAVHSGVEDDGIANSAASEVTSSEKSNNAATVSVSAGISVGLYSHAAAAAVGNDALIVAPEIGVGSSVDIPWNLPSSLTQWDGISTLETAISDLLQKSGAPIMTSYVDAQSDTGDVGLAGAVNYLAMQNSSTAWVNSGAHLECNTSVSCTANPAANWTTPPVQYGTDDTTGDPLTDNFSWTAPIDIVADNSVQTINDAGNFKLLELNGTGGEDSSTSVGGGFNDVNYLNTTIAGVAANAVISVPAESLAVDADSSDTAITVTPTAGRGSGVSANVIMAMANVTNVTHASISNAADVTAGAADVHAHEGLNIWTVAGAVSQGSSAGVGVGVGVNNLHTNTQAYIGDNSCDAPGSASSCTPAATSGGQFKLDTLNVQAFTDGQSGALAVAGSEAKSSDQSSGGTGGSSGGSSGSSSDPLGGALGFINTAAEFLSNFPALKNVSDQVTSATSSLTTLNTLVGKAHTTENKDSGKDTGSGSSSGSGSQGPKFGLAISGSGSVNIANLATVGYVDGVTVMPDLNASNTVTVNGLNNTFLISASGSGALASAKNKSSSFSAGIAGAVAFSLIQNSTNAYIEDSTLSNVDALAVQALSGGSEVDIGLGLAVNTSTSSNSISVSGSFSLSGVQNNTSANLNGDSVTGSGSAGSAAKVIAYNNTTIGAGGGSLSVGGKGSAGIAVTLSDIGNLPGTTPTTPYGEEAAITGGTLADFNSLSVEGLDSSRIVDGAIAVAATTQTLALTGEFVFNNIGEVTSGSIGGGAGISGIAGTVTVAGAGVDPNGKAPDGAQVSALNTLLTGDGSPVDASLIDFSGQSLLCPSSQTTCNAPLGSAIYGVVGGVSVGKNAAGLGFVLNNIGNSDSASVSDASITTGTNGALNLDATDNTYILGLAVGVGVSTGQFAGVGSVTANLINDTTSATLGDIGATPGATSVTAGSLGIAATNGANINALAGNVAISTGSTAAGVAISFNEIGDQANATLANATTNTGTGNTTVAATSNGSIESAAVAAAVGDSVALSGSFSLNDIGTDDLGLGTPKTGANATLEGSSVTAGNLNVQSSDSALIQTLAGSVAVSPGAAAVGAAFTLDNIADSDSAEVNNSTLTVSGSTGVNTTSTAEIDGLAVGGAVSGELAIVGSFTANVIDNSLDAGMSGVTMNAPADQTGKVQVTATDQSQIKSLAGAVAVSGGAGVGVSVAVNVIGDTANAHVDGGDFNVTDLTVQALSQDPTPGTANIQTIAAGVGGGADIGGAASVAVNVLTGGTNAYIDNGAIVTAADNVGVLANTQQGVDVLAGSIGIGGTAAGIGVGAVVNYLDNGTSAYIAGSATQVTANAKDASDTLTVNTGTLANPPDVMSVESMSDYVTPDLSETTRQVQGVAVNASTEQNAATLGISAALSFNIGSVSLAIMGNANVIAGTTSAYVDAAKVTSASDLGVNASNHSYNANFDLGVAASGGFSGAAAVSVNSFNHDTSAYLSNATATANTINVNAQATQDAVGLTAGLAGGIVGAAGTGIVNIFDGTTSAYADQGSLTGGALTVNANSEDDANLFGGAGAIGGAAVAGTFVLAVSENNTSAYVGDASNNTAVNLTGALDVEADSTTDINSLTVSGSAAGGVGIAGMAVVNVVQNRTNAYLDHVQQTRQGAGVTVKANENITLKPYTGAVAGGGTAGVGAAANLAILQSQVGATVTDSNLDSAGAVQVQALSSKDIEAITVTAGVGGTAGISGGASLILFGAGSTGSGNTDVMSQLGGTLGGVSSFGSQNNISDPGGNLSASQASQLQQDSEFTLLGTGGVLPGSIDGTSALISASQVTASSVNVTATDTTYTKSTTGALGVGGVGAGAAIAYTGLYDQVTAVVDSASMLTTPSLTVSATEQDGSGPAAEVDAYEGAGGLVGLGVSAAVANVSNTVTAGAAGTLKGDSSGGSAVNVNAADNSSLSTTGVGASVGLAAAGLVITQSNKSSTVTAELGDANGATAKAGGYASVALNASDQGAVSANSTGGSGGYGVAADGADANATDSAKVTAQVGKNAQIATPNSASSVSVTATDTPDTSAKVFGVSVAGGIGLAASVATAEVNHSVASAVLDGAQISGAGTLSISASSTPDANSDPTAYANAIAGGGGVLAGADGSVAIATSGGYDTNFNAIGGQSAAVAASTGTGVALPAGNVSITATNTTKQSSNATGVAVGFLALGATVSQSGANTSTTATLGDGDQGAAGRGGNLTIQATGTDNNAANSTAGSGGAIAGNASVAQTDDTPTVTAGIGNNLGLNAGTITLDAAHTDNYSGASNSVNAAIAGASGSDVINNANANVTACIGIALCVPTGTSSASNTALVASGAITVAADNYFNDVTNGNSAQGAGGGVFSGQAATSSTNLNGNAAANVGDHTTLNSGTDFVNNPGGINISAESGLNATDTVTLSTGGAISGAGTNSSLTANLNNSLALGQQDVLNTLGQINLGTDTQVQAATDSEAHTWGLAGAAVSDASTQIGSSQSIGIGSGDVLTGFGDVNITAGLANGFQTSISGLSNGQSYIRGLVVIPDASATTTLTSKANVNVASGATVESAGNVTLGTYEGTPQASADGTGHGYELGFIPATNHSSNISTQNCGAQGCGTLTLDGTVVAGLYHTLDIEINSAGQIQPATGPEAPFMALSNSSFNAQQYVENLPGYNNSSVLQLLATDVASNAPALAFSDLYAAGGNVTLHADNIVGSGGSVTAYGAPTITVNNYSPDYLVFGSLDVPSTPSGQVVFTGGADQSQATANGVAISMPNAGQTPSITINDIYTSNSGNSSQGPAIFLSCNNLFGSCSQSDLEANGTNNLLGLVSITDENGSYGQFNNGITAQSVVIDVPNGLVGITNPYGLVVTGQSPLSTWQSYMLDMSDPNIAVAYVVNWMFSGSRGSNGQLTVATLNQGCSAGIFLGCNTAVTDPDNSNNTPTSGQVGGGVSWVFYGTCLPAGSLDCSAGTADYYSPIGQSIGSDAYGHSSDFQYPLIPVEPLSVTVPTYPAGMPVGQTNSQLTGAQVAIQAKYIDVDSNITAGNSTTWSTQVSSAIQSWITDPASNPDSLAAEQAAGHCANNVCPIPSTYLTSTLLSTLSPGDSQVTADYNVTTGQIVLNNVNASGGGFVYLNGGIISTNQSGSIHINDGYGHVTVDNLSGIPLVVNNVNTGNGAVGEVQIVDTLKPKNQGTADTTWYVYSQGSGLSVYNNTHGETTLSQAVADGDLLTGASSSYQPLQDAQLTWTESANMYRTIDYNNNWVSSKWMFNYPNPQDPHNPWMVSPYTVTVHAGGEPPAFQETVTGAYASAGAWGYDFFHGCNSSGQDCHWNYPEIWETDFMTYAGITVTDAVKADNPIAISFQGNPSGLIAITSNNAVTVAGQIHNPSGPTSISASNATPAAGYIAQGVNATVLTDGLTLAASSGIGGSPVFGAGGTVTGFQSPFKAQLVPGSAVNAVGGAEGVQLAFTSSALIGLVSSGDAASGYGDVSISAQGDLNAGGSYRWLPSSQWSGPYLSGALLIAAPGTIIAHDITLTSSTGGIGNSGPGLQLVNGYSLLPQSGGVQGSVTASALNDIALIGVVGNMLVDQIASTAGNVSVTVPNGSILDANALNASQTLSQKQLEQVWNNLKLAPFSDPNTGITVTQTDINNAVTANTVQPFENLVAGNYQNYWRLLDNGSVSNGQFQLNSTGVTLFGGLAQAAGQSAQQYASAEYQQLVTFFQNNLGSDWQTQSEFVSYVPNFTYTATSAQITALTQNASYANTGQLTQAINATALLPSSGTLVGNTTPNISGRQVTLSARTGVGELGAPVTISVSDLQAGTLTPDEAAALATAITPGDVTPVTTGTTITGLQIAQTAPLYVNPTGPLSAKVDNGSVYLQANQNLALAGVIAGGNVWLAANGNITDAALAGQPVITTFNGGNLTLISGNGNLGTPAAGSNPAVALNLNLAGDLLAASAGQSIVLDELYRDLTVGHIYAMGDENIQAPEGSILADANVQGLNFIGQNITLDAHNDLGSSNQPLEVQDGVSNAGSSTGLFNGTANGGVSLLSPANTNPVNTVFAIGTLTAGGDLAVTTGLGVDLDAADLTSSNGMMTLASGNDAVLGTLVSQQQLTLTAFGNLTLDAALSKTGNINVTAGDAFAVTSLTAPNGSLGVTATGDFSLAANGELTSGDNQTIAAGAFTMGTGSQLTATGPVAVTTTLDSVTTTDPATGQPVTSLTTGNITLGSVTSSLASGLTLNLDAAGMILGNGDGQTNLTAAAGAQTQLQAGDGIGSAPLPLLVMLPWLQANTQSGGIYIKDLESLSAPNGVQAGGDLNLDVAGDFAFGTLSAGGNATLTSKGNLSGTALQAGSSGDASLNIGGDVMLTALTAGGSASVTSGGQLGITTATTGQNLALNSVTGLGFQQLAAGGNLVAGTQADILGGSFKSGGNANFTGANLQLDGGQATGNLSLTAQQALNSGALTAGGAADLQSGGAANLTSLSAGQGISFQAGGNFAFQQLTAGGGITGSSQAGIVGGSLNAGAGVNLSGVNLGLQNLVAGSDVTLTAGQALQAGDVTVTNGNASFTSTNADMTVNQLTVSGAAILQAGGALNLGTAGSGASLSLTSVGDLRFQQLAGGNLVAGTQADILGGSFKSGGNASFTGANLQLDGGQATGSLSLTVQQALNSGALTAGGAANLQAGGATNLTSLSAGQGISFQAGGNFAFQQLTAGGGITGSSQADIVGGSLNAGGGVNLSGVNLNLQNLVAGSDVTLTAQRAFQLNSAAIKNGGTTFTANSMHVGQLTASGAENLKTSGPMTLGTITGGQDLALTAGGNIRFQQLTVGGDLNADSQSSILGGSLNVTGSADLSGVNLILQNLLAGGGATLTAQQALQADSVTIKNGGAIFTANNLSLGQLTASGPESLKSDGAMTLGTVTGGQDLALTSGGDLRFQQLTAGGNITGSSQADILGGSLNASGGVNLSGVNLALQDLVAGSDVTLAAQQALQAGDVTVTNGSATFTAHSLTLGQLTASGSENLKTSGPMTLGTLTSGQDLALTAGGSIQFQQLTAGGNITGNSQGDILGGALKAVDANLSAPGTIQFTSAAVGQSLNLAAADIAGTVTHTVATSPLLMSLGGFMGGVADNVALEVNASGGLTLVLLKAKQAQINTTAQQVTVNQGYVPGWFYLVTPAASLLLDDSSATPALRPVDVQLYQPQYGFQLVQNGKNTYTNSYVVHYQYPYEVQVPNYDAAHLATGPAYDDESVVRNTFRNLMNNPAPLDIGEFGEPLIVNPDGTVSHPQLLPQTVTASVQGAVNTGAGTPPAQNKQ